MDGRFRVSNSTPPCEIAVKEILPALRAIIAQRLVEEKGASIYAASKLLGITPAAVSNYVKSKRGNALRDILITNPKVKEMLDDVVDRIKRGDVNLSTYYCILCAESRKVLNLEGYRLGACFYENMHQPKF